MTRVFVAGLLDEFVGGLTHVTQIWKHVKALSGYDVMVISQNPHLSEKPSMKVTRVPSFGTTGISYAISRAIYESVVFFKTLFSRADVLYERHRAFDISGPLVQALKGIPRVVEVNGLPDIDQAERIGAAFKYLLRLVQRWSFKTADAVVNVNPGLKPILENYYGVPSEKIFSIGNGADETLFKPLKREEVIDTIKDSPFRFLLEEKGPLCLFVGNLAPWQGVETIVETWPEVKNATGAKCVIVGDGILRPTLEEKVKTLGLEEDVIFLGKIEYKYIPYLMNLADVCMAPFRLTWRNRITAPTPIKLYEYLSAGRCVITSDMAGVIQDMKKKGVLHVFKEGEFARDLTELLTNEKLRRGYEAKARDYVLNGNTWRDQAARTVEVVKGVLKE